MNSFVSFSLLIVSTNALINNYNSIGNGAQPIGNNNQDAYQIGQGSQPGNNVKYYYPIGNGAQPNNGAKNLQIGGGVQPGGGNNYPNNGQNEGSYCNTMNDCRNGLQCTPSVNGVKICLQGGGGNNGGNTGQINVGGYVGQNRQEKRKTEKLNGPCEQDADCDDELACTLYFGELMCRPPVRAVIPLRCETESDCPSAEYLCVFSTAIQQKICYHYGDTVTDGYVIPIKHTIIVNKFSTTSTSTPIVETTSPKEEEEEGMFAESHAVFVGENKDNKHHLLSPAIKKRDDVPPKPPVYMKMEDSANQHETSISDEKKVENSDGTEKPREAIDPAAAICQFDHHCRMGESCSGRVEFVDRNVTVCRYDVAKKHRQCIYHSDCISGQRCTPALDIKNPDKATCEPDIVATMGRVSCFYDYQCSGGEKCTMVDEQEKKFMCRPPATSDPRSNQLCSSNAQCPFQQVCRRTTGVSMCVDVSISQNPTILQEKVVQFVRNLLFRAI